MSKHYTNKFGTKSIRYTAKDKAKQRERKEYQLSGYNFCTSDTRNQARRIHGFLTFYAKLSSECWPTLAEVQSQIVFYQTALKREYATTLDTASYARTSILLMPKQVKRDGGKLRNFNYEYLRHWRNRIAHFENELRFWRTLEYIAIHQSDPLFYIVKR